MVQDSARHGAIGLPGIAFAIASCIAYISMKGVMMPDVSAGSNQTGARETCEPMVMRPSGAALAGFAPKARAPAARYSSSRRVACAITALELAPSYSRRDDLMGSLPVPGGLAAQLFLIVMSSCNRCLVCGGPLPIASEL